MRTFRRLLVALVVLAVVLLAADRVTAVILQGSIERGVSQADGVVEGGAASEDAGGDTEVSVSVGGFPLLTQLAAGRLESLTIRIPAFDARTHDVTARISDISAHLDDVTTSTPHIAGTLQASGAITQDSLASAAQQAGVPGAVTIEDHGVVFSGAVLGVDVRAAIAVAIDEGGRGLVLSPTSASVGGAEIPLDTEALPVDQLLSALIPLDALPEGIVVRDIAVEENSLRVALTGRDVDLSSATEPQ